MDRATIFSRLYTIPCDPPVTPEAFCASQPCVHIHSGPLDFVLIQPTSTFFVYLLGILWLGAALHFYRIRGGERSRLWWSAALALGGLAAIFAGTSYQAFGYEIKCAGRAACAWTSWWEVGYLTLQAASMDAMIVAVAYSCAAGRARAALIIYAAANAVCHLAITAAGALIPVKFMISFELLILFSAPNLLLFFALCGWRYAKHRRPMDLALLRSGAILAITTAAYFTYFSLGITQTLWQQGIWFSENDVLHILMILWITYTTKILAPKIKDAA